MRNQVKGFLSGGVYFFCNYLIANIPSWHIRKFFYLICGMKVGKHSRIMMKVTVTHPWKIKIGNNTVINEYCYLDGRGGLSIGNNVNVALYSMLITGTHDHGSKDFYYYTEPIKINDDVWLAARSIVLNGCVLNDGSLVSAGAVLLPRTECESNAMYGGVPAKRIKSRDADLPLEIEPWIVHFR